MIPGYLFHFHSNSIISWPLKTHWSAQTRTRAHARTHYGALKPWRAGPNKDVKCRCAATAKRRVRFLGARAKFNPVILQQAEGFKCQPTVASHQLFSTHLPLNANPFKTATHTHTPTHTLQAQDPKTTYSRAVPGKWKSLSPLRTQRCPRWSFLRPTLTSSLTSASTKEGTATSPLAYLGHTTKAPIRIGTP